ncbi:MAG TPA: DUF3471 domain-containing protein [Blastocatellia bacterium]|nr:DUF3471 domain-containing protein [Blastocatellia bacterium]
MKKAVLIGATFAGLLLSVALGTSSASDSANGQRTFSKDVAPIFFKHCADCHRPGDIGPMSLLSYKDARPWAKSIREKVVSRQMPPWHADGHYGKFLNDARLSQQEVDTIAAWVDQGAREGNPKDLPPLPKFPGEWKLGKPDVELTMPEEYTLEAQGSDEYINFYMPTSFKQDTWVRGAEIHPGNRKVVHHVVAFIQSPEMARITKAPVPANSPFYKDGTLYRFKPDAAVFDDGCAAPGRGLARGSGQELGYPLCFYTPGKDSDIWPDGTAKLIPAGSIIIIQMHYSKVTGKVEKDRSSVGLYLAKQPPEKEMASFGVLNHYFKIPPGAANHEVKGCYTFSRDVELYTYLPHMHVRGKDMKYDVIYPDGRQETLLYIPAYNFNWQLMYRLEKPVLLPKGTKMIVTAHFDNSAANKSNPDPTKTVRFGDPTYDEMMVGYFDMVTLSPVKKAITLDPKTLDLYAGDYSISLGAGFKITREGDHLLFTATGQPSAAAYPESATRFFFRIIDAHVTFTTNDSGQPTELLFEINGQKIVAKRVVK